MKKYILLTALTCLGLVAMAENENIRAGITVVQPEYEGISAPANRILESKMNQMVTKNGYHENASDCLAITAFPIMVSKETTSTGMYLYEYEVNFVIGEVLANKIFASESIELKGVGSSSTKAAVQAFRQINPTSEDIQELFEEAQENIARFYTSNEELILRNIDMLIQTKQFEAAMQRATNLPDINRHLFLAGQEKALQTYEAMKVEELAQKEKEGQKLLLKAQSLWGAKRDYTTAAKALEVLNGIDPATNAYQDAIAFIETVSKKLRRDEAAIAAQRQREWEFKVKQYEDKMEMEQMKEQNKTEVAKTAADRIGRLDLSFKKDKVKKWGWASKDKDEEKED